MMNDLEMSRRAEEGLDDVIACVRERWTLGRTHGIGHWNRVRKNGISLLTPEVDRVVVLYFAYLHDSCREDDWEDLDHGERAAQWIGTIRTTLLQYLTDDQVAKLQTACRLHTTTHKTGDPTIDACFDADRLDLWRVGIKPDPKRMATAIGAQLAAEITVEKMYELANSLEQY